jgi:hypothetical protein
LLCVRHCIVYKLDFANIDRLLDCEIIRLPIL